MATLQGRAIKDTYKDLLQISNGNAGVDATLRTIEDGEGTTSALQVSTGSAKVNGDFDVTDVLQVDNSTTTKQVIVGDQTNSDHQDLRPSTKRAAYRLARRVALRLEPKTPA